MGRVGGVNTGGFEGNSRRDAWRTNSENGTASALSKAEFVAVLAGKEKGHPESEGLGRVFS